MSKLHPAGPVTDLIALFPTLSDAAEKLETPLGTLCSWRSNQRIPLWRRDFVMNKLAALGLKAPTGLDDAFQRKQRAA